MNLVIDVCVHHCRYRTIKYRRTKVTPLSADEAAKSASMERFDSQRHESVIGVFVVDSVT